MTMEEELLTTKDSTVAGDIIIDELNIMTTEEELLTTEESNIAGDVIVDEVIETRNSLFHKLTSSAAPQANRVEIAQLMKMLIHNGRPSTCDVYGNGPLLLSDIPENCKTNAVIMGIDEAGRGPVLGPMVYGAAFWAPCDEVAIPRGFHDSKALSADVRSALFQKTLTTPELGFVMRVLHASEISRNMLRKEPYNLNAMSHDAAMSMIRAVLDAGVTIDTCYIDTVGNADHYQTQLERVFGGRNIKFVVEKKADAKYPTCSAASVVAKVARDRFIESWKFTERHFEPEGKLDFGSGYPSDPKCKVWMEKNLADSVFCFPDLCRFSWGPAKKAVEDGGIPMEWEGDEEEEEKKSESEDVKRQQLQMQAFVGGLSKEKVVKKRKRSAYFENKGLRSIAALHHG